MTSINASRARAETRFAALEKKQQRALSAEEEAANATREKTARLRSLRLAREADEAASRPAKPAIRKRKSR